MKGIYLGSYTALHPNYDIDYQDINGLRDIGGDMLDIELTNYDIIIATPPCNYWTKANYRRETSEYALKTKHLLPDILDKLRRTNKPYIVENIRNAPLFKKHGIHDNADYIYIIGRHTYFTNIPFDTSDLTFEPDNVQNRDKSDRQGDKQVHTVIERWLSGLENKEVER